MKLRAGDAVVIIAGKDKGKTGTILKVLHAKNRVVVSDCNMRTKHVKSYPNRPGQILKFEASINASNVMVVDAKTKKRSRIGAKLNEKGKSVRIAKRSGEEIKKGKVPTAKKADSAVKDAKKATDAKSEARNPKSETKKEEKVPFWKKMGFGSAEEADKAEVKDEKHTEEDHSIAEEKKVPDTRTHERGK